MKVRLDQYNNDWYDPGAGPGKRTAWYFVNVLFFRNGWNPLSGLKVRLLRLFGARVGKGVVIKRAVNIKYPWKLTVGDHVWIGARATVGPGVTAFSHAVLAAGSVANRDLEAYTIYQGVPAVVKRAREIANG